MIKSVVSLRRVVFGTLLLFSSAGLALGIPWAPRESADGDNEFNETPNQKYIENLPASKTLPTAPKPKSVSAIIKKASGSKKQGGAAFVGPTWTFLGPAPIPNGQTVSRVDPVSGRVSAIAVHPTNSDVAYVGTAQGGLYRTLDGGVSWTQLMDNASAPTVGTPLAIGSIAIDPSSPTRVFVGTGEGNLSADSYFGSGFYIITNADSGSPTVSGPYNAASGLDSGVAANADIFTGRSIVAIAVDPTNANNVFVATSSGVGGIRPLAFSALPRRGIYRSTNALSGTPTWTRLQITGTTSLNTICTSLVLDVEPASPGPGPNVTSLVAMFYGQNAADPTGIYRSQNALDATPTFTQSLALPNFINGKLAIQGTGVNGAVTVYATADQSSGTLYKSTDGGANFLAKTGADGFAGGQGFYDISVGVDQTNPNNVSVGGQAGDKIFRRSTDGATTFTISTSICTGLHADVHAIAYAPSNGMVIYHGNDGGIWRSIDGGSNWTSLNVTGFSATQFSGIALHPTDAKFTLSGSQDNGTEQIRPDGSVMRVDFGDGGYSLIDQNAPDTTNVVQYHTYYNQGGAQIGTARVLTNPCATEGEWTFHGIYGGSVDPTVYCDGTTDTFNGINFSDNVQFYAPMALGPGSPNTWYFGTDKLYRSTDMADSTTLGSTFLGDFVGSIGISPQDDNVRLVGTVNNGWVFATTTGSTLVQISGAGATNGPTNVTPAAPAQAVAVDPNNKNIAYVTFGGFGTIATPRKHVWKVSNLDQLTTGGSVSFQSASNGLPDLPVNSIAIDPQSGSVTSASRDIYVGTDIGVYRSVDGGANWAAYGAGFPRCAVFGLAVQNPNRLLRAATHGRGLYDIPIVASAPSAPTVVSVSSRKTHGAGGTFDIDMPLAGGGVESRKGAATVGDPGDFTIVVRFTNTLAATQAGATISYAPGSGGILNGNPVPPGTGNVASFSVSGTDLLVQLTNVSDVQTGTLTVSGVTDSNSMTMAAGITVPLAFNIGDTTGNKTVDVGDITQVKNSSGAALTAANFRRDVNVDGSLDVGDIVIVKNKNTSTTP